MIRNPRSDKDMAGILAMLQVCFPGMKKSYFVNRIFCDPRYRKSREFIVTDDSRIVSHAQVFRKAVWWAGARISFVGLGFICTLPGFRGNGYAGSLVRHITGLYDDQMLGLFTRMPEFYEEFGFFLVARKRFRIQRPAVSVMTGWHIKIRRCAAGDMRHVRGLYAGYFSAFDGAVVRESKDWQHQFSYFDEDKRLFLVLETGGRIKAYLRCKRSRIARDKIEIVEYASISRDEDYLGYFVEYLFAHVHADVISGDQIFFSCLSRGYSVTEEREDSCMMVRYGKTRRNNRMRGSGRVCFLQADGF